jgi:hypothetical protein
MALSSMAIAPMPKGTDAAAPARRPYRPVLLVLI